MNPQKKGEAPSPQEMMAFAKRYNKKQWDLLCKDRGFLNIFTEDLLKAQKIANVLLR